MGQVFEMVDLWPGVCPQAIQHAGDGAKTFFFLLFYFIADV